VDRCAARPLALSYVAVVAQQSDWRIFSLGHLWQHGAAAEQVEAALTHCLAEMDDGVAEAA
jgi:hypothetical protein